MKLGETIVIIGFDNLEPALLIVVEKMVGNYVKDIIESKKGFENIKINMKSGSGGEYELEGEVGIGGTEYKKSVKEENLFFAINLLFEELRKDL